MPLTCPCVLGCGRDVRTGAATRTHLLRDCAYRFEFDTLSYEETIFFESKTEAMRYVDWTRRWTRDHNSYFCCLRATTSSTQAFERAVAASAGGGGGGAVELTESFETSLTGVLERRRGAQLGQGPAPTAKIFFCPAYLQIDEPAVMKEVLKSVLYSW